MYKKPENTVDFSGRLRYNDSTIVNKEGDSMLHCILGGCGTGKSTKLIDSVRTAIAAEKQVIVLSPEQFSSEAEERLYDQLHARAVDFSCSSSFRFRILRPLM